MAGLDSGRAVVSLLRRTTDRTGELAILELDPFRLLPGTTPIGFGPVAHLENADGELWMTLPWEGKVVRAALRR